MSSEATGKDDGSGVNESQLKQQSGLRKPFQSTQEKLQNGLGMDSVFRIYSVVCTCLLLA